VIAALIIVFREVFEAGLIIGIVLAVTRAVAHRNRWIIGGVLAGVLAACVVAAFAGALSNLFAGMGQELFNAAILSVAVVMLTWHNVWMARHGKELAIELAAAGRRWSTDQSPCSHWPSSSGSQCCARQRGRAVPLQRDRQRGPDGLSRSAASWAWRWARSFAC
jgi:high-affinity Fe2+/Pb2+ permease